jgi:hypothetical protein
MIRLYLWFCRVLFVARGPWVRAGTRSSLRPLFERGTLRCTPRTQSTPREGERLPRESCLTIELENRATEARRHRSYLVAEKRLSKEFDCTIG